MLIPDLFSAFRQGKELANAATWKNRTMAANALAALATTGLAIAAAFGYRFDADAATVQAIAGGIAAVVCLFNTASTAATSAKVGLPAKPEPDPPSRFPDIQDPALDRNIFGGRG